MRFYKIFIFLILSISGFFNSETQAFIRRTDESKSSSGYSTDAPDSLLKQKFKSDFVLNGKDVSYYDNRIMKSSRYGRDSLLYSKSSGIMILDDLFFENTEKYLVLIGLLLVTLLVVGLIFLYSLYKAKRNAYEITEQANMLIHQKNEELERLNQLKNKLFSIIAHDVRSPLNNLAGVLSLIGQGVLEHDEVQLITGKLTNNVKETTNFLDNLLIWSRSQMNGIRMDLRELEMFQLANETMEVFRFQCEEKKLTLKNEVSENIFVYADREMIKMVLRNLVSNAIKFSIPGGLILIKGSAKAEDDFAIISVSDEGIGVKKEFQDKLFGVDNYSTVGTMDEKGSGIGLMLCRDFVERNGGKIWMESTQNKGSNFFFSLPQYHMAKTDDGIKNLLADIL